MSAFSGRAADLPEGSVVATATNALFNDGGFWRCTDGTAYSDNDIDDAIRNGAQILRVGDGR